MNMRENTRSIMRKTWGWALAALAMLASSFGGLSAQVEQDVAIWNDHLYVHQVFVFDAEGERHLLGFVGHDELEFFDVPSEIEAMGSYRIAVQQHLPLPQLGVPVTEHPLKLTPVLQPRAGRMVSIIVGDEVYLSAVEVY